MSLSIDSTIPLTRGHLPRLGLGVYQARSDACVQAVATALRAGYRHVDTAQGYKNEKLVGRGIATSGIPRSDVFITTKYMPSHRARSADEVYAILRDSLKPLNPGVNPGVTAASATASANPAEAEAEGKEEEGAAAYIDLMLIHAPWGGAEGRASAWAALARAQTEGWVRDIGVSNFGVAHLEALPAPTPAVNQIELHPWCQQRAITSYCSARGIVVQAYCPLVRAETRRMEDPAVRRVCERVGKGKSKGKSAAQVLLRWSLQKGYAPLPKSVTPERIQSNADIYDFELDEEDMRALDALDEGKEGACSWNPVDAE